MGWKNWPYWLKGGVIGIFIGIIYVLWLDRLSIIDATIGNFFRIFLSLFIIPLILFCGYENQRGILGNSLCDYFVSFIIILIIIIISILIGLVYGRIKKKREIKNV